MSGVYEVVVGLEIHAELATKSKIFCGCTTKFGGQPNTQVCPICLGLPGTLPVLNQEVLNFAIRAGLALNCSIAKQSKFDRKNYFYPDLPKAYQVSQYDLPIAENGKLEIKTADGTKTIGITRIHMEEDAGKLLHLGQGGQIGQAVASLVDYNRTGVPLIEIVSEPDIRSSEEAYAYLVGIKEILQYAELSDCNMEEGSLRCDANISVRPQGQSKLGTKTEIKNMNSFKHVRSAIDFEAKRQIQALSQQQTIIQETRLWDAEKGITRSMRSKEEAHDYRYFPEPDLPLLEITEEMIAANQARLPELPQAKRKRFSSQYQMGDYDAMVLTSTKNLANYFEEAVSVYSAPKAISNWITVELLGKLNQENKTINESPVSPEQLAKLVKQVEQGAISGKIGKQVFAEMLDTGQDPEKIIQAKGLTQISDPEAIGQLVQAVMTDHPGPVEEYHKGKTQAIGFLVGQVMKRSQGQANPKLVNQVLKQKLG